MRFRVLGSLLLISSLSFAQSDAWVPPYKTLFFKGGLNYLTTSTNYDNDGFRNDLAYQGQNVSLQELRFFLEPEYAMVQGWSGRARLELVNSSVTPAIASPGNSGSVLSRFGLGDITLGVKHAILAPSPSVTGEITIKIPTYSNIVTDPLTLLPGDGNIDMGLWAHTAYRVNQIFFDFSPGVLFRFGGYASAFVAKGDLGIKVGPGYIFFNFSSIFSLSDNLLFDPSPYNHNAAGTGGSYARLSGSPSGIDLGLTGGVRVAKSWFVEAHFKQTIWGHRYGSIFELGANAVFVTDFFEPDTRKKIQEVPFDTPNQ